MIGFLLEHLSWLLPGVGPVLGILSGGLPKMWKIGMIAAAAAVTVGAVLWIRADLANKRATIAEQQTMMVTLAAQRDQEKATAEAWRAETTLLEKRIAREAAARERERQALRSAIQSRDKIIDEVRREKTARDPAPGAWRPALRRVQ